MDVWIGTSGYTYPDWVGAFYPAGMNSANMLAFYAEHFPLVELNFTYYQMPRKEQFARMVQRVPAGFRFIVMAHRSLTHDRDLREAAAFHATLEPMRETKQLLAVLCQFPQQFHFKQANLGWLDAVQQHLPNTALAVEFRHQSWNRDDVVDWLNEKGIELVSVDVPDITAIYPRQLVQSGRSIYVRFHSRRAESWYGPGHDRYDYLYSDEQLGIWIDELAERAERTDRALLLFNNFMRTQAIMNAQRLAELMAQRDDVFQVMTPAQPAVRQGTLF
jgi:uncharacterized protein YecE (DUF72 family)